MPQQQKHQFRIIGGRWKGRRLRFPAVQGLRPTQESIRETVFNWLMQDIPGSQCLDMFAGTGALGWEALSRGAQFVLMAEQSSRLVKNLLEQRDALKANKAVKILNTHWPQGWQHLTDYQFDIVFLDPPFYQHWLQTAIQILQKANCIQTGTLIYMEIERSDDLSNLPKTWEVIRHKTRGNVRFALIRID